MLLYMQEARTVCYPVHECSKYKFSTTGIEEENEQTIRKLPLYKTFWGLYSIYY